MNSSRRDTAVAATARDTRGSQPFAKNVEGLCKQYNASHTLRSVSGVIA